MTDNKPWAAPMPEAQFNRMRDIISAPSPVGFESAMTMGVIKPQMDEFALEQWQLQQFKGNAGAVWDSHPGCEDMFTVMLIGHADKIRLQVRHISSDGKIWVNSDSFLPCTLIGHEVKLFSEDPQAPGDYRVIQGGTIEALGAIHFSDTAQRTGAKGIKAEQLYLDLQIHGEEKKKQIENLGIRPGDVLMLDRPIKRGFSPDTFYGAYLDNGLGCFITVEVARLIAEAGGTNNVRCLFAIAAYEEIGRFGSRVLAGELKPDVIIGIDVNHDYTAAPNIGHKKMQPIEMGKGFSLGEGAITSPHLNACIQQTAIKHGIPIQRDVLGRDTGTDGMAGVLASIDCAATTIGIPNRNMHTISESSHTGDVLSAIHAVFQTIQAMDEESNLNEHFKHQHPRLDQSQPLQHGG